MRYIPTCLRRVVWMTVTHHGHTRSSGQATWVGVARINDHLHRIRSSRQSRKVSSIKRCCNDRPTVIIVVDDNYRSSPLCCCQLRTLQTDLTIRTHISAANTVRSTIDAVRKRRRYVWVRSVKLHWINCYVLIRRSLGNLRNKMWVLCNYATIRQDGKEIQCSPLY